MSKLKSISVLRQEDREFLKNFPLIFWLIFIVFGVLLMIPVLIYIGFSAKAYTGNGAGTADEPYQIATCDQLQSINQNTSAYYVLIQDVDCSDTINWNGGTGFNSINDFTGYIDGRNHSITGLYINRITEYAVGLFEYFDAGEIKNLKFLNSQNTQGQNAIMGGRNVGVVAGELRNDAVIKNVHSELNVVNNPFELNGGTGGFVGGIVGLNRGYIYQSSSSGVISLVESNYNRIDENRMGGIAGSMDPYDTGNGIDRGYIENSYFSGTVTTGNISRDVMHGIKCGGIVGYLGALSPIKNNYSSGNINCTASQSGAVSGGLIGFTYRDYNDEEDNVSVQHNFFSGTITSSSGGIGGIIGGISGNKTLDTNYFDSQKSGTTNCSPQYPTSCNAVNTIENPDINYFFNRNNLPFLNWDQEIIWQINTEEFPTLRTQTVRPDAPTNLQVVRADNDTSLNITWDAPLDIEGRGSNLIDYHVQYKLVDAEGWATFDDGESTSTTATIPNVDPNEAYQIRVKAIASGNVGEGLYSELVTASVEVPQKIENVQGEADAKTINLTWNGTNRAETYKVEYKKSTSSEWVGKYIDIDTPLLRAYIHKLDSDTQYNVRVAGVNDGGQGEWSDIWTVNTIKQQAYTITNCQQLQEMQNDLSGSYTLANNIDCTDTVNWNEGTGFEPVGNGKEDPFTGDFNGNNKTIKNLYSNKTIAYNNSKYFGTGMFGFAYGATIKNVRFTNAAMNMAFYLDPSQDQNQDGIDDNFNIGDVPSNVGDLDQIPSYGAGLVNSLPDVGAGVVAGVVWGGGTYSNIITANSNVLGASSGAVIGYLFTFNILFTQEDFMNPSNSPFNTDNQAPQTTLSNLQSSGAVNGIIGGGTIGFVVTDGTPGSLSTVKIDKNISTASVDALLGGGIVGASVSLSAALPVLSAMNGTPGDLLPSVNSAVNALPITISNSSASGRVSTCNNLTTLQVGVLGGIVGAAINTRIENSHSSSKVEVCSNTYQNGIVYGGSLGGVAGIMLLSQIDSSYATGQVGTKINTSLPYGQNVNGQTVTPGVQAGVFGGLVGTVFSVVDQNDSPVINKSYSTGKVKNDAGVGMVGVNGGLIGMMLGSGTIQSSYATGNIETNTGQYAPAGGIVAGGLIGSGIGIDAMSILNTVYSGEVTPAQGIVINKSYTSGSITTTKQKEGGFAAIQGGLGGILLGNAKVLNSRATGNISNNFSNDYKANTITPLDKINITPSIAGGLLGVTMGVDGQPLLGIFTNQNVEDSDGVLVDNSYATGNIKGTIAGGLVGYADLKVRINKVYAEGDVQGTTVGGLMGGSGLLGSTGVTAFSLFLGKGGQVDPSEVPPAAAATFQKLSDTIGPVSIQNAYATGSVTAQPLSARFINYNTNEDTFNPANLPTLAGGLVGFYSAAGGEVKNSYASGKITVIAPQDQTKDSNKVTTPTIPSSAGGLFGLTLAFPMVDLYKVTSQTSLEKFTDYFKNPQILSNSFSASKITAPDSTLTGPITGFFVSPLNVALQFVSPNDKNLEKIFAANGLYYDKNRQTTDECVGLKNPKQLLKDLINNTDIPDGTLNTQIPASTTTQNVYDQAKNLAQNEEQLDQGYDTYAAPAFLKMITCNGVNENNSQPDYFINNSTNAPLNKWDFETVWVTQKDDYPKFTAGPESGNPTSIPEPPKVTTVSEDNPSTSQIGGAGTPTPSLAELLNPDTVKGTKDNWLISLLKKIPEAVAKTIPYTLLLVLIAISMFYTYSALLEKHRRKQLQLIIRRIYASGKARATYLSIISHYLNTPLTKMRSTVELLHSTKKLPDEVNKKVSKELSNVAKSTDTLLTMGQSLTMNQQNDIKSLESIKLPSILLKPAVGLPVSIIYTLVVVVNVLFVMADRYDVTGMMALTQLTLGAIGGATLVISYFYLSNAKQLRAAVSRQANVEKSTASQQAQFIDTVYSALSDEVDALDAYSKDILSHPKSDGFKAGLQELHTVVEKMNQVATLSRNVPGIVWKTNIQQSLKSVFSTLRPLADKNGVSIQTNIKPVGLVNVDDTSLAHLVSAPIKNAIEYSKSGSKVTVAMEQIDNAVVITVADKGKGISEKQLFQLFEPFSRFESTQQFEHQGMGLDLYLCQVITEHYGGSIVMVSKEGQGTTTRIKVPVTL